MIGSGVFLVIVCAALQVDAANLHYGNKMNQDPPAAPTNATFLFECKMPKGVKGSDTFDMCWLDSETLILAQYFGRQILSVAVDVTGKGCNVSVVDAGLYPWRLSCYNKNTFYATDLSNNVRVYSKKTSGGWSATEWNAQPIKEGVADVATNDKTVVALPLYGKGYVFNTMKKVLNEVGDSTIEEKQTYFTYLTPNATLLVTTGYDGHLLFIHSLTDNKTTTLGGFGNKNGQFNHPAGVTTTTEGNIVVCDYRNNRLPVFTTAGTFINNIQVIGGKIDRPWVVAITPGYLAFVPGRFLWGDADRVRFHALS